MKTITVISSIFIMIPSICQAQKKASTSNVNISANNDSTYFNKDLPVYNVDTCLYNFFKAIVIADQKVQTYDSNLFFYSLTLEHRTNLRDITVFIERWNKSVKLDYTGVLNVEKMAFLCRGEIEEDQLFHIVPNLKTNIKLISPPTFITDSVDLKYIPPLENYTYWGYYNRCSWTLTHMAIYSMGKLDKL